MTDASLPPTRTALPRFVAAGLLGLCVDLLAANVLLAATEASIPLAGGISHVTASVVMYLVHERWTFGSGTFQLSLRRFLGTLATSGATLAIRLACLAATSRGFGLGRDLAVPQLLLAAGVSTAFGYVALRRVMAVGRSPA